MLAENMPMSAGYPASKVNIAGALGLCVSMSSFLV